MYAVIQTGGKQVRVQQGDVVHVEKLPGDVGTDIVFDRVLLVGEGDSTRVGTPTVAEASVRGSIVEHGRGDKILIRTYKKRKNSNRKSRGHRQSYTAVKIETIDS